MPFSNPPDEQLAAQLREILLPLFSAAVTGGVGWFAGRRKNHAEATKTTAEAGAIGGDLFQRQVKLLADLWEAQNHELREEIKRLHERDEAREAEIIALRKALDRRAAEADAGKTDRTVAFVPPAGETEGNW